MRPSFSSKKRPHGALSYAILFGKRVASFLAVSVKRAGFQSRRVGQLGHWMALSTRNMGAPLLSAIFRIVFVGSEKQMRGITTRRIVAMMTDDQSLWNRTIEKLPTKSVRPNVSALQAKTPISTTNHASLPRPAIIRRLLVNFRPKAFFNYFRSLAPFGIGFTTNRSDSTLILVGDTFFLHKSVLLICATLSATQGARAFLLSHNTL